MLQSVSGLDTTKPSVALVNYVDPLNESIAEWITYTSINSTTKELQGVVRGAEKGSGKSHSNGVAIAFPISESHINNINDVLAEVTGSGIAVGKTTTQTLTNKRITKRVQSVTDASTVTPDADANDCVDITAIAQAFTIANPTGTPTNFQTLVIRIKDNGTARAITWGNGYVAGGVALPSTTILSKILTLGFIYNTANTLNKWQCVASAQES